LEIVALVQMLLVGPLLVLTWLLGRQDGAPLLWLWDVSGALGMAVILCAAFLYCTETPDE
jgi:hypothetical protein